MNATVATFLDWVEQKAPPFERARRLVARARSKWVLAGCERGSDVLVHGNLKLERQGRMSVGARSVFVAGPVPTRIVVGPQATLGIGPFCYFNYGALLEVSERVQLGERCMFGSHVRVSDAPGKPIIFGNNVWVAHGAIIQPGVTIGDAAVVAAGSVVTSDVPPGMLALGNPARMLSQKLSAS